MMRFARAASQWSLAIDLRARPSAKYEMQPYCDSWQAEPQPSTRRCRNTVTAGEQNRHRHIVEPPHPSCCDASAPKMTVLIPGV